MAATKTETKKVTPRRSAKPAVETKPARKAVTAKATTKAVVAPTKTTEASQPTMLRKLFVYLQGQRPTSGPRLWSHTQAALEVLGMTKGAAVLRNVLVTVVGQRAVDYHTASENFSETTGRIALTSRGIKTFELRTQDKKYDAELTDAFKAMFLKGKASEKHHINPDALIQVGLRM